METNHNDSKKNKTLDFNTRTSYYTELCIISLITYFIIKYLNSCDKSFTIPDNFEITPTPTVVESAVRSAIPEKTQTPVRRFDDKNVQTDGDMNLNTDEVNKNEGSTDSLVRPIDELVQIVKTKNLANELNDLEVLEMLKQNHLPLYKLLDRHSI